MNNYKNISHKINKLWNEVSETDKNQDLFIKNNIKIKVLNYIKKTNEYIIENKYDFNSNSNILMLNIYLKNFPKYLIPFIKINVIYSSVEEVEDIKSIYEYANLSGVEIDNVPYLSSKCKYSIYCLIDDNGDENYYLKGYVLAYLKKRKLSPFKIIDLLLYGKIYLLFDNARLDDVIQGK